MGNTVTVVCENCGSSLDATDPDLKILHQSMAAQSRSRIPLGTRGFLAGIEWEAIGYMERSGGGGTWQETLLFNPWAGYRFLVDDGECWRLGTGLDQLPVEAGDSAMLDGDRYHVAERYAARVDFVAGEFYWRVEVGETVDVADYEGPGEATLSCEVNAAEIAWTRLEVQGEGVVESAFGIAPPAESLRSSRDPFASFPAFHFIVAAIASLLLVIIAISGGASEQVLQKTILVTPGGETVSVTVGVVKLGRNRNTVSVRSYAELDNAWIELDFALVNRTTQERFEADATAERYSGSDSDGGWSEGDRAPEVKFGSLPRGDYDLIVEATAKDWRPGMYQDAEPSKWAVPVTVVATRNVIFLGNMLLALIAIWALPLLHWWWLSSQEDDE
ncbi:MAG: DUF4178 domain-containing protein [Polymorphobacter sp.]